MYKYDEYDQRIVDERVAQFADQTGRYLAGELSEDEYRPLRLQNGVYIQRHAPMLRIAVPYRPRFYAYLILLHGSLLLRVVGDLTLQPDLRRWGGLFNVVAVLLFLALALAPWPRLTSAPERPVLSPAEAENG